MSKIVRSVGRGGVNLYNDVITIKKLLNKQRLPSVTGELKYDGDAGNETIARIEIFQKNIVNMPKPDGRIDPGGKTMAYLTGTTAQSRGSEKATITIALLRAADDSNTESYYKDIVEIMNTYAKAYAINTPRRVAHFLAQIAHESRLKSTEENGNYSAKRMREIFGCKGGPKNYDPATSDCKLGTDGKPARLRDKPWTEEKTYANNAKNLLNYVYASRLQNGSETSGDGYKYRGRGMIQLTGKANYDAFTKCHNKKNPNGLRNFVANPDLLITEPKYGIESAFFFCEANNLNSIADTDKINDVAMAVNGGLNGLSDREAWFARIKKVLEK